MKNIILAVIVTLSSFTFANAQPPAGVERSRSRSATVNRVRPQGNPALGVDRVTRPPRQFPNTQPPVPRPPRPVPVPVPVPVPNRFPPRYRYPPYYPYPYGLGAAAVRSRSRTVINNGGTTYTAPATQYPVQSQQQYSVDPLVEQLKAENAALREENAYLKGQLNATK